MFFSVLDTFSPWELDMSHSAEPVGREPELCRCLRAVIMLLEAAIWIDMKQRQSEKAPVYLLSTTDVETQRDCSARASDRLLAVSFCRRSIHPLLMPQHPRLASKFLPSVKTRSGAC